MASRRDPSRPKVQASNPSETAPTVFPPDGGAKQRANSLPKRAAPTRTESAATSSRKPSGRIEVSNESRYRMICEAAYLRAERRGFAPGQEIEDWLAAEQEVERLLAAEHAPTPQ
jgi:hypothetical protein